MITEQAARQLEHFAALTGEEMARLTRGMDRDYFACAVGLIQEARAAGRRLHVSGVGKPHHIGGYLASLLSSTGTPSYFLDGTEATHGSAGQLEPGDVVILLSYYGDVPELVRTMETIRKLGVKIIAVTGFEDSAIAAGADVSLNVHVREEGDSLKKPPRLSMLATLYAGMALSLLLQESVGLTREQYLRWHPSGHLGQPETKGGPL